MAHAKERANDPSATDALDRALIALGDGRLEDARSGLQNELLHDPSSVEAAELLSVVDQLATESRPRVDVVEFLNEGTSAFTSGQRRDAIEAWKLCLIEEPDNRRLQLMVLMACTDSSARQARYAEEVLAPSTGVLQSARPEESAALLLLAQTVESPGAAPGQPPTEEEPLHFHEPLATEESSPSIPPIPAAADVGPAPEPASSDTRPDAPSPDLEALDIEAQAEPEPDATPFPEPVPEPDATPFPEPVPEPDAAPVPEPPTAETEAPSAEPHAPAPSRARVAPRPRPKPRSSGPWVAVGATFLLIVAIAGGLAYLLSDGGELPAERMDEMSRLVAEGQYPEAIRGFDELIAQYGERPELLLGRGRARLAFGAFEEGVGDLKRALAATPDDVSVAQEIGDLYYAQDRFEEALDHYRPAIESGAASGETRYRLAASLVRIGDGGTALEHLDRAIDSLTGHGEAQFLYGQLLNQRGRYEEAETALRASESLVEAGGEYLAELTLSLIGQGRLDAAEETARHYMQLYPGEPGARALLGEIYLGRQQFEQARAELIQALRMDRSHPRAQVALGRTWLAIARTRGDARDLAKAKEVLSTARGVDEGARLATLGQIAIEEGDLEAADRLLRESLDHGAPPLPVHLALADAKARNEDVAGAIESLRQAAEFAPGDPSLSLSLGVLYAQLGDGTLATEHYLETLHGIGLVDPAADGAGPVVLPRPYVPVPSRFDVNRSIRSAYDTVLAEREEDAAGTALKALAEATTFALPESPR